MREFGKSFDSINWQWYYKCDKDNANKSKSGNRQVNEIDVDRKQQTNSNRPWQKGNNSSREFRNSNRLSQSNPNQQEQNKNYKQQSSDKKSSEQKTDQGSKKSEDSKPSPSKHLNTLEKILKSYVPVKNGTCFNCHEFGHNFRQCKQDKQIFCEVCGFPGFIQKDCPYCPTKNAEKTAH